MVKSWCVRCQVNLCAEKKVKVIVKANTERKARIFATDKLKKDGYFFVKVLSCEEITED